MPASRITAPSAVRNGSDFGRASRRRFALCLALLVCGAVAVSYCVRRAAAVSGAETARGNTVRAAARAGQVAPRTELKSVSLEFDGPSGRAAQLSGDEATPLSLASADFDEDGVPDLVGGFAAAGGGGLVTFNRGNADALYPNYPDALRHKAEGTFQDSPFITRGRAFDLADAPALLGAGDFDADGHFDIVAARAGSHALYLLRGDGTGNFGAAQKVELPGALTAMKAADVNRADGLTDILVAVEGDGGASLLVFEGPEGALAARPERIELPAPAASIAAGQFDEESSFDMAVAAGSELLIITGRDRKLSLDERSRADVTPPAVERRAFSSTLVSVVAGHFGEGALDGLAILTADGSLQVLGREGSARAGSVKPKVSREWRSQLISSDAWSPVTRLVGAGMSGGASEDLLILDPESGRMKVAKGVAEAAGGNGASAATRAPLLKVEAFAVEASPVAVLPMRLDDDALNDLVMLRKDAHGLSVSLTTRAARTAPLARGESPAREAAPEKKGAPPVSPLTLPALRPSAKGQTAFGPEDARSPEPARDATPRELLACAPGSIALGTSVSGFLGLGDCRYLISGEFFDRYTFTGFAGQRIAAAAISTEFDPELVLYAPNGAILYINEDSSDKTNPRIPLDSGYITLPVNGVYTIEVTTLYFDETGNYQLGLVAQPPNECPEIRIASGSLVTSALVPGGCGFPDGRAAEVYSFFGAAGQNVALYMASGSFDPYLALRAPSGATFEDDDGGFGTDARIPPDSGTIALPETGIYRVFATSFQPFSFGLYELELQITGPTVVVNTNDSGIGSLRQAILNANAMPGPDVITFAIGSGAKTINLLSPLPPVAGPTFIDGTTQPGFAGTPIIELNGTSAGIRAAGLKLTAGASRVRGLVINRFTYGVAITNSGGNIIDGNYIGTNIAGTGALGNKRNGIVIFNSVSNLIGGTTAASRNVISGNLELGVEIGRTVAAGNVVAGNYIGTNAAGTAALGNLGNGVLVKAGTNNAIGGTVAGARNVISGNGLPGIALAATLPVGNSVQGNFVGTNAAGTAAVGNGGAGIIIGGFDFSGAPITANNNLVGGTVVTARNVISGNNGGGIEVNNLGSTGNSVQGNFVGTNAAGTGVLGNNGVGVSVTFAPDNVVGGNVPGAGNVISGNKGVIGYGVAIGIPRDTLVGGRGVTVQGNFIGTDSTKTLHLGNAQDGVFVDAKSVVNTITGNTIAFNGKSGVYIPNNGPEPGVQILIELNGIFANGDLAIDLGERGVTPNDPLDTDVGANLLQNFPTLKTVVRAEGGTSEADAKGNGERESTAAAAAALTVNASLESTPNTTFTIHWQLTADLQCSPKNQPMTPPLILQKIPGVVTNASGVANFSISFSFPGAMDKGVIYANAIDPNGNTSENSQCLPVSMNPPPSGTLQFGATAYSTGEAGGPLRVTVTRVNGTVGVVTVNYSTADATAAAGSDYQRTTGTLSFADGVASKTFDVPIVNDASDEGNETFTLTLSGATGGASLGVPNVVTVTINDDDKPALEFESAAYSVSEAAGVVSARVLRRGDASKAISVDYATSDGTAIERRDYTLTLGRLNFASGETAKSIPVLIANDAYVESPESFQLTLSNPLGAVLGTRGVATITINSDDAAGAANPIDSSEFYVKQQYADFLNRQPDTSGLAFWKDQTDSRVAACASVADPGARAGCKLQARATVSAGFFLSIEFQQIGYLVHRFYTEAYGRVPRLREFLTDAQDMGRGVVVNSPGWEAVLQTNQRDFTLRFVQRPEFVQRFGSMSNADYVNALFLNAGVAAGADAQLRQALVNGLTNQTETRATVLRKVADSPSVYNRQYNSAFVLMQYFGYLRRNPDDPPDTDNRGYNFWLSKMNDFTRPNEDALDPNTALGRARRAQMIEAFVDSIEYRTRFAP